MLLTHGRKLLAGFLVLSLLQGCAAVVVGAGVGAASVAHDRRTLGTQVDDKTMAGRVVSKLNENAEIKDNANINVHVYNGVALLYGQAPSEVVKQQAYQAAAQVKHLKKIHNLVRIGTPIPTSSAANDIWLASKVRAQLLADERIDGLHISVTVEDSEVFLMGLVNNQEADTAVDIARNVNGVARVVKAFEYL